MRNDYVLSLTPTEFEKYCYEILKGYAEEESLKDFTITHNKKIETYLYSIMDRTLKKIDTTL